MSQFAIYLDDKTASLLDEVSDKDGISRSAWVRKAVQNALRNRLPESFFDVLGKWEDSRSPSEILGSIRKYPKEKNRAELD